MKIVGIEGMEGQQIELEFQRGARFVIYQYCISVILLTFKRPSDIYFVRAEESAVAKGLGFSAMSILLGWCIPRKSALRGAPQFAHRVPVG